MSMTQLHNTSAGAGTRTLGSIRRWLLWLCMIGLWSAPLQAEESISVFRLGERFFGDSLYNLALEQYQKYTRLKRSPENDPTVYRKIALCYYRMDNMRKAAEAFEEYVELFPSDDNVMEGMFLAGEARKALGDYKRASEWFYRVWSRFVGSAMAQRALLEAAICAEADANLERAAELYDIFYRRFPKHPEAKQVGLGLVRILIKQQQYAKASEILEVRPKAWKRDKEYRARALYYQGLLAKKMQRDQEAAERFAEMAAIGIVSFPEAERAYRAYIEVLTEAQKYETVTGVYQRLSELLQKNDREMSWRDLLSWADNARRAKEYSRAEELYTTLLSTYADSIAEGKVQYRLAECQIGQGAFAKAIETLQSLAVREDAEGYRARAMLKIGDLYYNRELYLSAIAAYQRYLQLPDARRKDAILFRIGRIYQERFERYAIALREFETLLKRYPGSAYYHKAVLAIAQCYEALGDYADAVRHYEYLVESGEQGSVIDQARARIDYLRSYRIKDAESAVYDLAELLMTPSDSLSRSDRLLALAEVYDKHLKDHSRALEIYERVLENGAALSDSVRARITFRMARNYERLYEKTTFEKSEKTAAYTKEKALSLYREVSSDYGSSRWADDAAFQVMMLTSPNIAEYEEFIQNYPQSRHQDEVLYAIAQHYEQRAEEVDEKFAGKAIEAYGAIVRRAPAGRFAAKSLLGLAHSYFTLGRLDSTESAITMFFERFADSEYKPEALFVQAMVHKAKRDYDSAIETFRNILYQYPFSSLASRARFELGRAQLATDRIFEALNNFSVYLQNYPNGRFVDEASYGVGRCRVRMGKHAEAKELFDELLEQGVSDELNARIHYELATISEAEGDTYEALNHYKSVLRNPGFPGKGDVYLHVGKLYFRTRIYAEAAQAFQKALPLVRSKTDSVAALRGAITALTMEGKLRAADDKLKDFKKRYTDRDGDMAEIVFHEGLHFVVAKKYDKAIKRFRYVGEKYDQTEWADNAAYQIALSYYYGNKKKEALELFRDFVTKYPQSEFIPAANFKIAMVHHESEDFARAAEMFAQVSRNERADRKTRFRAASNAAVDYQKIAGWDDAAAMYRAILRDFPDEASASLMHLRIGFALVQASQFETALQHFEKANVDPAPENKPELLYWMATCHAKLGNYQRAITEYLKVPYLYSGVGKWGITSEFEAARLYERLGQYERAQSLYRKIVRSDGEQGDFGKNAAMRLERLDNLIAQRRND